LLEPREKTVKILKALQDPVFFCEDPYFLGLKPFPKQAEVLRKFYEGNYTELVLIAGNRSGKTTLASIFASYEAFKLLIKPDPAAYYGLTPGSLIFIIVVATSEKQASDTIFREIFNRIARSPFFREFRPRFLNNEIIFPSKGIHILCGTSSSASLVGRNVKLAIFDELARFEESTSKRGAWNVYTSLKRSTATFGSEGYCISISSIRHSSDIMMQLYQQAQTNPKMLALKYATWEFNPRISFEDLQYERQRDPATFWRDFGSVPFAGTMQYFSNPDVIPFDSSVPNNLELMAKGLTPTFDASATYVLAGDPALKHDAFGLALIHEAEPEQYIVDGAYRFAPEKGVELSPIEIKNFILKVVHLAPVVVAVFDTWQFPELQEEIASTGVLVVNHIVRKEDYDRFKEACYRRTIKLCEYPWLRQEFRQLQIINAKKVDHPPGGSKDVADAVVNSLYGITELLPRRSYPLNVVTTFRG